MSIFNKNSFLIFGAARSGLAAARLLKGRGKKVAIYDEAPPEKLNKARAAAQEMGVPFLTPSENSPRVSEWEVFVLSPGIPPTHRLAREAMENGCLVRSELEIGSEASPAPILAITGTNGKTTVTHLVTHLFEQSGRPAIMAGNVGRALCDAVLDERALLPGAVIVCEVSSFQLETIDAFRPAVTSVLNVTPDHLDRYVVMDKYVEAKRRITMNQQPEDALVINDDCPYCRTFASQTHAGIWRFSVGHSVARGTYLESGMLFFVENPGNPPRAIMARSDIPLPGLHNVENVLAALTMAAAAGLSPLRLAPHVRSFRPVPHRIEFIGEIDGVRYYNDSKATNLDSLEKALESFDEPIVLIAGGRDKKAPWTRLNELVARRVRVLILIGEAAPIGRAAWGPIVPSTVDARDMVEAVAKARSMAARGDVVLLSPACASYDMYNNFEERGDHFREIVKEIEK